jgi:hypothetical protein
MNTVPSRKKHALVDLLERHSFLFSMLLFVVFYVCVDRLLNEYYLPDAKGIENSYYHHGLRKNFQGTVSWGEEKHRLFTNDLGFKDAQSSVVPRQTDRRRVLFIGDSFTEGAGLPFEQTFVGMFRKAHPELDVLNAGVVSYSPKLFYYRLKYLLEIERLRFDELIVFIDISDISDEIEYSIYTPVEESFLRRLDAWLRSISFTYKMLRNNLLNVEKNATLRSLIQKIDAGKAVSLQQADKGDASTTARSSTNQRIDEATAGPPQVTMPKDFREKRVQEKPRWTFDKNIYEKWGHAGMALAKYHMDLVWRLIKERSIPITIAVYPWPDQIRAGDRHSIQEMEWRRFSEERGIRFISYFGDFVRDDPEEIIRKYFIPGDVHWNKQGHALVFQKLGEY